MKKRKWLPTLFVYVVVLFVLAGLVFFLKEQNSDIIWARNYYNIISSIISSLVGITGIILGLFYYFDKERRRKIDILKTEIEEYDSCVKLILKLCIKNKNELDKTRIKIDSINDRINMMLDSDKKFIQLNNADISTILRINSIVDKSEVIMRTSFNKLKSADRDSVLDNYEIALKNALLICYGELK
jgi:hypothetical protein